MQRKHIPLYHFFEMDNIKLWRIIANYNLI